MTEKLYRWHLYDDWCSVADAKGIGVRSQSGGAVYMNLPKEIEPTFFWILWTPLNAVNKMSLDKDWQHQLDTLRDNEANFYIEASHITAGYDFFPEINHKLPQDITRSDIETSVDRILDPTEWPKWEMWAQLQQE